jgi:membrane protein DedA with SNARE-associated domain
VFLELFLGALPTLPLLASYALLLFLLVAAGIGGPLSQDVLLVAAAGIGSYQLVPLLLVAWVGVMAGDALSVWLGRRYGARWIRRPWAARFVPPERLPALEEAMARWAGVGSFVARWLPGQRAALFFIFGTLRMRYRPFWLGAGLAALVQVALYVAAARMLRWDWRALAPRFDAVDTALSVVLVIVLVVWWMRGRRRA